MKFFKKGKRGNSRRLVAIMLCASMLAPAVARGIPLSDANYNAPEVSPTWSVSDLGGNTATGLAANFYFLPENSKAGAHFPLPPNMHFTARPGYIQDDFKDFDGRSFYCVAHHAGNYLLVPGQQMFFVEQYGIGSDKGIFDACRQYGNTDEENNFNFLMTAIASGYPVGEVDLENNMSDIADHLVMQVIGWAATNEGARGFKGCPPGSDGPTQHAAFAADLAYFKSTDVYASLDATFPQSISPDLYAALHRQYNTEAAAGWEGVANYKDALFCDIWCAAYLTSCLTPDWDKLLSTTRATAREENGMYYADVPLFNSDAAKTYLKGISFEPYGDWVKESQDDDGTMHFVSPTGETDENGCIGSFYWPDNQLGSLLPVDQTKAKLYTFEGYTYSLGDPTFSFGRTQIYFSSVIEQGLQLYIRIGDEEPDDPEKNVECVRHEHTETFLANYNVNLLKYDGETGKPLADSHWDILERFDDSQLDSTDLDRSPDDPGTYESGLGELKQTEWGDDTIEDNYDGDMGVTISDTNLYNWGNDDHTQFERWGRDEEDPCRKDDNVTGKDGLLYEIDASGAATSTPAHYDTRSYVYHKGYCDGHPAPEIEYIECDHDEEADCDCDEINQEIHDQAWQEWYDEVKKCEQLVKEGGFFHCIDPESGAAKKALEEDRDQFFKDFISLAYDYSAREIQAAPGYTLHGAHTDDIPIEWRTVTSSEYKDTAQATKLEHQGSSGETDPDIGEPPELPDGGDEDEEVDKSSLQKVIDEAEKLNAEDYESFDEVEWALENAQDVMQRDNATTEEVEEAEAELRDAIDNLVPLEDEEILQENMPLVKQLEDVPEVSEDAGVTWVSEAEAISDQKTVSDDHASADTDTADANETQASAESIETQVNADTIESQEPADTVEPQETAAAESQETAESGMIAESEAAADITEPATEADIAEPETEAAVEEKSRIAATEPAESIAYSETEAVEESLDQPDEVAIRDEIPLVSDTETDADDATGDINADEPEQARDASATMVAAASITETDDDEDDYLADIDLAGDGMDDVYATDSNAIKDKDRPEPSIERTGFLASARNALSKIWNSFTSILNMDDKDDDEGEVGDPPSAGGVLRKQGDLFKPTEANSVTPPKNDIVDWTFVAYDHRTEGEIHFNKRDFDLSDDTSDTFGDYAQENSDGSLEGAVYGLFAAQDIIHPDTDDFGDGDTGVVFQAGDLVAVATTDRNGDGSFMAITEAPGSVYNYETGAIEHTDWYDQAPKNLYMNRTASAAKEQDIERFVGHNPDGSEITAGDGNDLSDTAEGNDTFFYKKSTNQGYDDTYCEEETTGQYPIQNNEDNNGNCWIGRPLIIGKNGTSYFIKELSRSEGYELSVYGKDGTLMTNREAFEAGGEDFITGEAIASSIERDLNVGNGNTFSVDSSGTMNGYILKVSGIPEGAKFYTTTSKSHLDESVSHKETAVVATESVPAREGEMVTVGGHSWEASLGDTVQYNGKSFTVNNVMTIPMGEHTVKPDNRMKITDPSLDPTKVTPTGNLMGDINKLFGLAGYRKLVQGAPWKAIPVTTANDLNTVAKAINEQILDDDWFAVFNAMEMVGSYVENGQIYVVIGYCYRDVHTNSAIYNEKNDKIYVKTSVPFATYGSDIDGFVYRDYDRNQWKNIVENEEGFVTSAIVPNEVASGHPQWNRDDLDKKVTFSTMPDKTIWTYKEGEPLLDDDGNPVMREVMGEVDVYPTLVTNVTNVLLDEQSYVSNGNGTGTYTIVVPQEIIDAAGGHLDFRILYDDVTVNINHVDTNAELYAWQNGIIGIMFPYGLADYYTVDVFLEYPGEKQPMQDAGTIETPIQVYDRPIRQKIRIEKDIQTLPEAKEVWYCLNCGNEIADDIDTCDVCGKARSTEETRVLNYANDTYAAFHSENISAERDAGSYDTTEDWLSTLNGGSSPDETPESIGNFRFKAYLKSNLERLYRDGDGNVTWMDRNGNTMTPQYEDTNGDGNYDTFTWKYDTAYDGKTVDFPEKDKVATVENQGDILSSTNVQKIYTEVEHPTGQEQSAVTSDRANNVWDTYDDPQSPISARTNAGEIEGYTTSEKGEPGDSVTTNAALYSYDGKARDRDTSDYLQDQQNTGYTRLLETRKQEIENGTGTTSVEMYNYEKFFDAIQAANTDIWDNDMYSTYDGNGMKNYPGQNWFETFYEKYQMDDADPDHSTADANQDQVPDSVDKADADNTAGGDRDTSFKPFRWIRENVFGDRTDYEKYPAERNGNDTENTINTSDYARANAQASDAVRQFAVKWYLDDEAAKLMVDNGLGENVANQEKLGTNTEGEIEYDEAVYDLALFNAIAKAYNYLKPFYLNDLDTIYSVEWDSAMNGGADSDFTTLSADINADGTYSNVSSYLPYGVYVIVEQQPERRDENVNDWESRSYDIEKPKEVIVPSVYEGTASNDTTDNYSTHYTFNAEQLLTDQAKQDNYLIRFGEENSDNTTNQDQREFVIRAHGYYGDFEVYKYGLDVDQLHGTITAPNSTYYYGGWDITQEEFDPLKDYYQPDHRGEAVAETDDGQDDGDDGGDGGNGNGDTSAAIGKENGGNESSVYHGNEPNYTANGNGVETANGSTYDGDSLRKRFFYASISEDDGVANNVLFKDGAVDQNNMSGMSWHDNVQSTTGELTAYDGKYAAALVPWTVTEPADYSTYDAATFSGYADVNERNRFYTAYLRINKTDSETGEYILHDDAIFGLYAASRYNSFEEIEEDAKLITDAGERARFLMQFKPGDAKFYLQDTMITGSKEFLEAMKARDITPYAKGKDRTLNESMAGSGERYTGIVSKGTPVCIESERVDLYDGNGSRTGQMTVWTTRGDLPMDDPETKTKLEDGGQNVGYFKTSQPIGAGVYVLAEIKPPSGYARSNPVAIEVYSDGTTYYVDGDMYAKVDAVRYESKTTDGYPYKNADEANARQ